MTGDQPLPGPGRVANAPSSTLTLRAAARRALFWIIAGIGTLLVAVAAALIAGGSNTGGTPLAADNPAPAGAMALAEVLRDQGVTVTIADSLAEARSLADSAANPTVFFSDEQGYLTADQVSTMAALAPRTVVAAPDFRTLQALAPEVGFGGVSGRPELDASCAVPAAVKAGSISPGGSTLTVATSPSAPDTASVTGCFPSRANTYSLIERTTPAGTLTLVPDAAVFSNEKVGTWGNAALALNLLGASDTLIWYLPTLADVAVTGPPSLGELTPGWVTPTLALLLVVALAAFIWRGRRFGPLVAENLPVTVRASETMEGRARLYARGSARLRAIDALRIGTVQRLARQVGLPRTATVDDVIRAVAELTGRDAGQVRSVLVDTIPANDSDLLSLSDRLQDLERATTRQAAPPAHERMDP